MPVFERDGCRLLFIHIPKTGGTYIEDLFRANGFTVHFWKPRRLLPVEALSPQHYHAPLLSAIFNIQAFDGVFASVRHPLNRLISEYRMQVQSDTVGFEAWAESALERASRDRSCDDNHLRPQTDFLLPGCRLVRQEDGFDSRFTDSLAEGFGIALDVKTVNRRRDNRGWRQAAADRLTLSPGLGDRVRAFYDVDFDRLGYQWEDADQ